MSARPSPRLIDSIRNEVREAEITMHKAIALATKSMSAAGKIEDENYRTLVRHSHSVGALIARVAWLYERFVELEKELENAYAIIDGEDEEVEE